MARKSFKTGIGNLIQDSRQRIEKEKEIDKNEEKKKDNTESTGEKYQWLLLRLERLEDELQLWRTGKLTLENFQESLKENNLKYNSEFNNFEEL